jgi:hypothetical protein
MFQGQVLTPSGWCTPVVGKEIACMGGSQRVIWQKIEKVEKAEVDLVTVRSNCLSYAISRDHCIKVHKASPLNPLVDITGDDIYKATHRKENRLRLHHVTHAYPEQVSCNPLSAIQAFALEHLDHECLSAIPEENLSIFRRYLDFRLVYPQAYLLTQRASDCYRMCHKAALALIVLLFPRMRAHDGLKKPKPNTLSRCYQTNAVDILQTACFFSGITSVLVDNKVKLYLHTKRGRLPFKPELTRASRITVEQGSAFGIDVAHPLVRHEGKIVVL